MSNVIDHGFDIFGKALKNYRKPLIQRQLAAMIGVTRTAVVKYETGERFPDPATVKLIIKTVKRDDREVINLKSAWVESFRASDRRKKAQLLNKYALPATASDKELLSLLS